MRPTNRLFRFCRRAAAAAGLLALLTGCGFQLRGETPLPFDTLYVGIDANSQFGANLRRAILAASPNTKLVASPKEAQAVLQQIARQRTQRQVSLNAQGRVEEYELGVRFVYRVVDPKGNAIVPDTTLLAYRQMPYNAQIIQAEDGQAQVLFTSMEQSLVPRILRRLTAEDVQRHYAELRQGKVDVNAPVYAPPPQNAPEMGETPIERNKTIDLNKDPDSDSMP